MIDLQRVTRENFDSSGLSNGYAVGVKMLDIESEILQLIKGVFGQIKNAPMRELNASETRGKLLTGIAMVQARAIDLFKGSNKDIFSKLNESIDNGFKIGKSSGARQTGEKTPNIVLEDVKRGADILTAANGNILKAEATAITGAVSGLGSAISLLTNGQLAQSDMTFEQAFDEFVVPQFEDGLPGKNTSDGRKIGLSSYAETVTRESSQQTLLLGESLAAQEAGQFLVQISAHFSCCPLCEPWQNAILIDDYFAGGTPDGEHELLSTAIEAGLFHYNCRHVKRIYIPGVTETNNPPNYDPEKVAVNYELEQEQRKLEREIRAEKRKLAMSLTDEEKAKAQAKIKESQAKLRGLVKYADENGYKVYRQNWREQDGFNQPPEKPYDGYKGAGLTDGKNSGIMFEAIKNTADKKNIEYIEPKPLEKKLTEQEIITRLTGTSKENRDEACSSLAFAYIGNKSGLDVVDGRGGESADYFSHNSVIDKIAKFPEVKGVVVKDADEFKAAHKLLELAEEGKEYYFGVGDHSAIIRKNGSGFEFLELQSENPEENCFHRLNDIMLEERFHCVVNFVYEGEKSIIRPSQLIECESLGKSKEFRELLGYINTKH